MEIVSLPLAGLPRPHPFAMERGVDAMEVCVYVYSCLSVVVFLVVAGMSQVLLPSMYVVSGRSGGTGRHSSPSAFCIPLGVFLTTLAGETG